MRSLTWILGFLLVLTLAACGKQEQTEAGSTPSAAAVGGQTKADFDRIYQDAVTSLEDITKKGNAWRDTGKLIKQAKEAADSNDLGKAMKLVQKAKGQIELAQQQMEEQKSAKPWLFN